eukprot:TRINITY_DN11815_c0_g2_i1.p1 TRINITY_DN11815_c0_g2~~TRINITY_DN11815_c0_g2_i1.p1  ORF type:complete len:364 (+),score=59.61 TRINITY_DN11815_c0_g2_i1:79-1092(+)
MAVRGLMTRMEHRKSWRALAVTSSLGAFSAFAMNQILDLRNEWKTKLRVQASACQGPTEGLEKGFCSRGRPVFQYDHIQASMMNSPLHVSESFVTFPKGPVLLLFLGDSLVSGVGAQEGETPAPAALPRSVAAELADCSGEEVRWVSVAITGADVQKLTEEGVPMLKDKMAANVDAGTVVFVLVTGANDFRKLSLGYRLRLRRLVHELRGIADDHGQAVEVVFLPALCIADAPLLQRWPLQFFLAPLCQLWEREKRKAISWFQDAKVLPFPAPPEDFDTQTFFAADLIHPSTVGYEWWAKDLASQIYEQLLSERHSNPRSRGVAPLLAGHAVYPAGA